MFNFLLRAKAEALFIRYKNEEFPDKSSAFISGVVYARVGYYIPEKRLKELEKING